MVINSEYYNGGRGKTILDLYSLSSDRNEKVIHRSLSDADAYDHWHLAVHTAEIIKWRLLLKKELVSLDDVPRKDKHLWAFLVLASNRDLRSVLEIGSSLMEVIEGLDVAALALRDSPHIPQDFDSHEITFQGIEISDILAYGSQVLHPQHAIEIHSSASSYESNSDLLLDRSVTNYAFDDPDHLVAFLRRSRCGLINTFFSLGDTFYSERLGKRLTYFSLSDVASRMDSELIHLYGTRAPGPISGQDLSGGRRVIEGFFYFGPETYLNNLVKLGESIPDVLAYMKLIGFRPNLARDLI